MPICNSSVVGVSRSWNCFNLFRFDRLWRCTVADGAARHSCGSHPDASCAAVKRIHKVQTFISPISRGRLRALTNVSSSATLNLPDTRARVAELADAMDSKSIARKGVPVRVRALVLSCRPSLLCRCGTRQLFDPVSLPIFGEQSQEFAVGII